MKIKTILFLLTCLLTFSVHAQEICDNGIDDDGDGLVDLNDEDDCDCSNLGSSSEVESLIPNASFEDISCCPEYLGQLDCADTWIQASTPTSDYFNTCDFVTDAVPLPMPDGAGCVGCIFNDTWAEYVGACTDAPLEQGTEYLISFDVATNITSGSITYIGENDLGPIEIVMYGSPNCADLPFSGTGCPLESGDPDWEVIGSILYDPLGTWSTVTIEIETSVAINAIALGPPCDLPELYNSTIYAYFFFDNLVLNEASLFDSNISETVYNEEFDVWVTDGAYLDTSTGDMVNVGAVCTDILELTASLDSLGDYQWFYEGVALAGETDTVLTLEGDDIQFGEFQFMLMVNGNCGVSDMTLIAPEYPIADYSLENACYPDTVDFIDESSFIFNIIDWDWNFGDGSVSNVQQFPDHFYDDPGPFDASLIVTGANFCKDTLTQAITFFPDPIADFTFENACEGLVTTFEETSTIEAGYSIIDWDWNFGDGNSQNNTQNAENTYASDDIYNVTLWIESDNGCTHQTSLQVEAYPTPEVSFLASPVCIETPNAQFDNTTFISSGSVAEWNWEFGDTGTSNVNNPSHIYGAPGEFDVTLEATSTFGCVGTSTEVQNVSEVIANMDYVTVAHCSPFCSTFEAIASSNFSDLDTYLWEFSDGQSSSTANTELCFSNLSHTDVVKYDVSLTVTNILGCVGTASESDLVEIWPIPSAAFDITPDITDILTPEVETTNLSIGQLENNWNFGDGSIYQEMNPTHYYSTALVFPVELIVTSDLGCSDSITKFVDILPDYNIYVPNSFSPNGDGINEIYKPEIYGGVITNFEFQVQNRWGDKVFTSTDPSDFWDGSLKNNTEYYAEDEIYVWTIKVKFDRLLEPFEDQGTVLIFR